MLVNGTHTGGGTYTIAGGGVLGGTGTIHTEVDVWNNGTITPGGNGTVGTLSIDHVVLGSQNTASGNVGFNINVGSARHHSLTSPIPMDWSSALKLRRLIRIHPSGVAR